MLQSFLAGIAFVVAWIVLAFGAALETGWVHVLLGVGVVLIARGVVMQNGGSAKSTR